MEFPVMCSDFPCVEMLNCHPLYMLDRLDEVKTDFIHFYFSIEGKSRSKKLLLFMKTEESLILNIREGFIKEVLYNDYFSVKITEKKRTFVTYNR